MNKNSKLGFDLIANSVDEAQPLLYRITVVPAPGADLLTIYVGQTVGNPPTKRARSEVEFST